MATFNIDFVIVGQGGRGGVKYYEAVSTSQSGGGGGGGGGVRKFYDFGIADNTTYPIVVGSGGTTTGRNSSAFGQIAGGGGNGGSGLGANGTAGAGPSGNGGGGSGNPGQFSGNRTGGAGTAPDGNAGGLGGSFNSYGAGGGGGAGGVGSARNGASGGAGGNGVAISIHPSSTMLVGRGGGGGRSSSTTSAGNGTNGTTPTSSYGGGGAGAGSVNSGASNTSGDLGQPGIVVVRYPASRGASFATGGTKTLNGGFYYHVFTANGNFTVSKVELPRTGNLAASLARPMRSNIRALQQRVSVAATLGSMSASISSKFLYDAAFLVTTSAMRGEFEVWHTVVGDVVTELSPVIASFGVEAIEPSPMPDTDVFIDNDFRYITGEAPRAETTYPDFGYFDGATLPALTAFFDLGSTYEVVLSGQLAAMSSDGLIRFPIETNFTGVLAALSMESEGFADNFRDVEFDASLAAMSADALAVQIKVAELGGTMPALVADILSFRPVHSEFEGLLAAMSADALGYQIKVAELDATLAAVKSGGNVWVGYGVNPSIKLPALRSAFTGFQTKVAQLGATLSAIRSDIEVFPNRYRDVEIATSLKAMSSSMLGGPAAQTSVEASLNAMGADLYGWVDIWSDLKAVLPAITSEIAGVAPKEALLSALLPQIGADVHLKVPEVIVADMMLPQIGADVLVFRTVETELEGTLGALALDSVGYQTKIGTLGAGLPALTSDAEVWLDIWSDLSGSLRNMRLASQVKLDYRAVFEGSLPPLESDTLIATDYEVAFEANLSRMRMSGLVGVEGFGDISARMGHMSADVDVYAHPGVIDIGTLPSMTADVLAIQLKDGRLGAIMPTMFGEFSGFPDEAAFVTATMPGPMTSEIWVGPPNQVDMNARLQAMKSFFYGGWPAETFVESVLPGMQSFFLGGQPYDFVVDATLAAMTSFFLVEGLPADTNQMGPVDFDGGLETERFTISGAVIFGFGKTFP